MKKIIKKNSRIDDFSPEKIVSAIWRAVKESGHQNRKDAEEIAKKVIILLQIACSEHKHPHVNQIRTITTQLLEEEGYFEAAKSYENFKQNSTTWTEMANFVTQAEDNYNRDKKSAEQNFRLILENEAFCPSKEIVRNFSQEQKIQFTSCVIPFKKGADFFGQLEKIARIKENNGSVGLDLSESRCPQTTIELLERSLAICSNQGRNKLVISIKHPKALNFLQTENSNLSLGIKLTEDFLAAVHSNGIFAYNDGTETNARNVFDAIANIIAKRKDLSIMLTTPSSSLSYGDLPLGDYECSACGSIYLNRLVSEENNFLDQSLEQIFKAAHHFLDNCIDLNEYPIPELASKTKKNRHVHLNLKKFCHLLNELGVNYRSSEASLVIRKIANELNRAFNENDKNISVSLHNEGQIPPQWHIKLAAELQNEITAPVICKVSIDTEYPQTIAESVILAYQMGLPLVRFKASN